MKKGWEIKSIGEVCEIKNGGTPDTSIKEYWDGDIKWITPKDMGKLINRYVDDTPRKITQLGLHKSSAKLLPINSIILSTRAPIGHITINMTEMATNQGCRGIIPSSVLNSNYLYFYLKNSIELLNNLGTGATFKELSSNSLASVKIPLPPLKEQKNIVAILDKAFEAIEKAKANAEKNLNNAKELFESYLQSVFENKGEDWEEKRLGEVCNVIGGGTPSKSKNKFYSGDIYWATVRDMKSEFITDTEHKISMDAVKNSSTNIIPKGNVIIATRVGLGKICLIENDTAINQDLKGVVPFDPKSLSVNFLFRWFKYVAQKIVDEGTGATVQGVKLPFIKSLVINLPTYIEQQTIVQKLDELSDETKKLENIYKKKIADLDELKKSVLQKAFRGDL